MGRAILSVIAGYLTMAVLVFVMFTAAYLALGADRAFRPGSYEVSGSWLVLSFVVSLGAAIAGGAVCAAIARRNAMAPKALAAIVLVLGFLSAVPTVQARGEPLPERTAAVGNTEAMMNARMPVWVALSNPIIGVLGVIAGSRLVQRPRSRAGRADSLPTERE
ncbi:hypothetical protein BH23PLA1_BH23PLA1_39530 [soil metagenome]